MSETTSEPIACQGSGFNPCPWQAQADVTLVCPAGAMLADCNACARMIYNAAPTLYEVHPLFVWGDAYNSAREFAGLPPAPPDPPMPPSQPTAGGLLARFLAWRRTPDGQLAETALLGAAAWQWHEHNKREDERLTASVMGWTRAEREERAWQYGHHHHQ
jgi:hypothetical protein